MNIHSAVTLHVVGNACIDTTLRVPRFPVIGETLVAASMQEDLGGKGLNQAVAAARAGAAVRLWAAVGQDEPAGRIYARVAQEGILSSSLVASAQPTDRSTILVDGAGENLIVSVVDCAAAFDPIEAGVLGESLNAGDLLVMQGNLTPEVTDACLALARARRALTIFNPSPIAMVAAMPWPLVDWVILNRGELEFLTERADPQAGARRLLAMGAGAVVVTLGAEGALLVDGGGSHAVEATALPVVDTAGAGDVVCGVFAGLLARKLDPRHALSVAVEAGSLSVSRHGTHSACPTRTEIAAMITRSMSLR